MVDERTGASFDGDVEEKESPIQCVTLKSSKICIGYEVELRIKLINEEPLTGMIDGISVHTRMDLKGKLKTRTRVSVFRGLTMVPNSVSVWDTEIVEVVSVKPKT